VTFNLTPPPKPPNSVSTTLTFGAVLLALIVGAAVALHQHAWEPVAYGALCAAVLFVALLTGEGVSNARKARRIALRAKNEVHSGPGSFAALVAERDRLRDALAHLQVCWLCGADPKAVAVVRRGSESGERAADVTDATESPDPGHWGA
jgi:hypothetical protein